MYWVDDYHVNDKIVIRQPTIGQIVRFGESKYFSAVSLFCAIPTDLKVWLWDNGMDWNEFTDFQLFSLVASGLKQADTSWLFGDLDFSKFGRFRNPEIEEVV